MVQRVLPTRRWNTPRVAHPPNRQREAGAPDELEEIEKAAGLTADRRLLSSPHV